MADTNWFDQNAPTDGTYSPPEAGGFTGGTAPPPPASSPLPDDDPLNQMYLQYLGRPATWADVAVHQGNPGGWQGLLETIRNSPEAQAYAKRNPAKGSSTLPSQLQNQYTDPAFITGKINEGFQQAYGRAPTQEEFSYWMGKMTTPDVFSDGKTRVGWNPYWQDRLTHPGSSSSGVAAGDETVVPGNWSGTTGMVGQFGTGNYTGGGKYPLASVMGSGLMQPWTTPFEGGPNFQAPTDVTQQNDPGWQFRIKEGLKAIERSAASKGTLLTGGTLKDLNSWAQNTASNEYGNVYNRAATEWERNYNRNLGEYNLANNIFNTNQGNQFSRLYGLSNQGLNAAGQVSGNNSSYATNAGDTMTGIGNANAAGQMGSANAWTGFTNGLGNTIVDLASYYGTKPKTTTADDSWTYPVAAPATSLYRAYGENN